MWQQLEPFALVSLGGLIAVLGGWGAQIHLNRLELARRKFAAINGIFSELFEIRMTLSAAFEISDHSGTFAAQDIRSHCSRYAQMSSDIALLPLPTIGAIDQIYGEIFILSGLAKTNIEGGGTMDREIADKQLNRFDEVMDKLKPLMVEYCPSGS
jgi:hypothetical protein